MNIQEVVEDLNEKLWAGDNNYNHCFVYKKHGLVEAVDVEICGNNTLVTIALWNDQDDSRPWIEKTKEYEPFSKTLMRNYKEALDLMSKIYKTVKK